MTWRAVAVTEESPQSQSPDVTRCTVHVDEGFEVLCTECEDRPASMDLRSWTRHDRHHGLDEEISETKAVDKEEVAGAEDIEREVRIVGDEEHCSRVSRMINRLGGIAEAVIESVISNQSIIFDTRKCSSDQKEKVARYIERLLTLFTELAVSEMDFKGRIWSFSEKAGEISLDKLIQSNVIMAKNLHMTHKASEESLLEMIRLRMIQMNGRKYELKQQFFVIAFVDSNQVENFTHSFLSAQTLRYIMHSRVISQIDFRTLETGISQLDFKDLTGIKESLLALTNMFVKGIKVHVLVRLYMRDIITALRQHEIFPIGPCSVASEHLLISSQVTALLNGSKFVRPVDVNLAAVKSMVHRLFIRNSKAGTVHSLDLSTKLVRHLVTKSLKPPI